MELEKHYVNRVGWLRAAVLGANDGLLSTTSIVIGVAAADPSRHAIILAALAGTIAGAMSMAAGEYVSVSSQADTEKSDINREMKELEKMPEIELHELAKIIVCLSIAAVAIVIFLVMRSAHYLSRILGASGIVAISRIIGFIVIAIGVQYISSSVVNILKTI